MSHQDFIALSQQVKNLRQQQGQQQLSPFDQHKAASQALRAAFDAVLVGQTSVPTTSTSSTLSSTATTTTTSSSSSSSSSSSGSNFGSVTATSSPGVQEIQQFLSLAKELEIGFQALEARYTSLPVTKSTQTTKSEEEQQKDLEKDSKESKEKVQSEIDELEKELVKKRTLIDKHAKLLSQIASEGQQQP